MADFIAYTEMMKRCSAISAEEHSYESSTSTGFTPSLPDDIFLNCLVRVPLQCHANLHRVSKRLRNLVQSPEYYSQRKSEGASSSFVCMLQPLPSAADTKWTAPVLGITLLDVQNGTWERLPAIPGIAGGLPTFAKVVHLNRELVVMGGWWQSTWEPSRAVFVYNFGTQRWRQGADMPSARSFFACGAMECRIIVAGGHDGDKKALNSVEYYDVEADSWSSLQSMSSERDEPTGVVVDGKFYVVSGYGSNNQGVFTTSAECYNPNTNSWSFIDNMWTLTDAGDVLVNPSSIAALEGKLYAVHGNEIVVYCPDRNTWTAVEKVPEESEKGDLTSTAITATGNALLLTGLVKKNDVAALRTLKLTPSNNKRKSPWDTVPCHEQFLNLAQTSCAFEL